MWLIGIDDTDMPGTRGTGRLARMLAAELAQRGYERCGVTRHQLLVHPDVPYTSHNSAACVGFDGESSNPAALFAWLCGFVAGHSPEGADPGVCLADGARVNGRVVEFGRRAQTEVVGLTEATRIGEEEPCLLAGLAGSLGGMIGSLAAVGLRASGDDGRFIERGRLRESQGAVRVSELLASGVEEIRGDQVEPPTPEQWVETLGWVRPRLSGGRAVLFVERSERDGVEWVVADRRKGGNA